MQLPIVENRRRVLQSATLVSLGLHVFLLYCVAVFWPFSPSKIPPDAGVVIELAAAMQAASEATPESDFSQTKPAQPEKMPPVHARPSDTPPEKRKVVKNAAKKRTGASGRTLAPDFRGPSAQDAAIKARQGQTFPPALAQGVKRPPPVYPELSRKRGQEGTVSVRCDVDSAGSVTSASIARGSGFRLLDEAALKAVMRWKFEPGKKDGVNVAGSVIVPVRFQLRD